MSTIVSVLTPVYNAERHLGRCIESVLGQTYRNVELIAVDDGSTDASAAILARYEERYKRRVRVISQENQGVAVARNRAIAEARGEVITFLDDDDYLDADFVERMLSALLEGHRDIVCGGFRRPDAEGKVLQTVIPRVGTEWDRLAVEPAWAKLYRTSYVQDKGLQFLSSNIGEDLHFTLPALLSDASVGVVDYCGYNWFYNEDSISNTFHKSSSDVEFEFLLDALVREFSRMGVALDGLARHALIRLVVWFLFYTARGDDPSLVDANIDRYVRWLDRTVASWREDEYATYRRPTGDERRSRVSVALFVHHEALFRRALHAYRRM